MIDRPLLTLMTSLLLSSRIEELLGEGTSFNARRRDPRLLLAPEDGR